MADKGKKTKIDDDQGTDHLDNELVLAIEKLQEIQDELEKVNEEASDKVLEVEQKYNEIRRPVYEKRNAIIHTIPDFWLTAVCYPYDGFTGDRVGGVVCGWELSASGHDFKLRVVISLARTVLNLGLDGGCNLSMTNGELGFSIAFLSHPALCDLLTEEDQKVFKYLQSLDVEDFKDVKSGYSITFTFRPNPYFEDTKLVKVFRFSDEGTTSISGSPVKWKDGMDLTNGVGPDKEGKKRPFQEESFFKWFSETQQKDPSDGMHDEVAEIIKEDLWPNPLKYFNNEADEEDYEEEDDNDDDDEPGKGNDGSDEDEEEQDEDDDADDN